MKHGGVPGRVNPLGLLLALGLLLGWVIGVSGCVAVPNVINVSEHAGLARASRLEIAELVREPDAHYVHRLTLTDPAVLAKLGAALDAGLPLEPQVDCLAKYRLSFVLATGEVQALDYYCEGGRSFLTRRPGLLVGATGAASG